MNNLPQVFEMPPIWSPDNETLATWSPAKDLYSTTDNQSKIIQFKEYYDRIQTDFDENQPNPFLIEGNIEHLRKIISDEKEMEDEKNEKIQGAVNLNFDEVIKAQKQTLKELEESRVDQRAFEKQVITLLEGVAKKDDIISSDKQIIKKITLESNEIQALTVKNTNELKAALEEFLPHKRTLKVSLYFLTLFSACFFADLLLGISIIVPFWNFLGIAVSCGFVLLSVALHKDWRKAHE